MNPENYYAVLHTRPEAGARRESPYEKDLNLDVTDTSIEAAAGMPANRDKARSDAADLMLKRLNGNLN